MTDNTTMISGVLDANAQAIRMKDAEAVVSHYGSPLVRFDLAPPLATAGAAAREPGQLIDWFATWRGPIGYELRDTTITAAGDIAFAHGFVRISGTKHDGSRADVWARQTVCLRQQGGTWKIVHEHTSTPFYMDGSLRAAVDLVP